MRFVSASINKGGAGLPFLRLAILSCVSLLLLSACGKPAPNFVLQGETMGTTYNITVVEPDNEVIDSAKAEALADEVTGLLAVFNQIASTYIEDSELNQLNAMAVGDSVTVSHTLHDMLLTALEVSWLSNGGFDVTVGPLVDLWGFGPGKDEFGTVPDDAAIAAAKANVGFKHIQLDMLDPVVSKRRDVRIDLSAIAKGYAVDQLAGLLETRGYQHFLVEIGGELRAKGSNPNGDAWRLAIEKPDPLGRSIAQIISVTDAAVATSGDYRNYFERDGERYSHTINPRTGRPITHNLASVTVIAESAAYADAMATAMSVVGKDEALSIAQDLDLAVYLIVRELESFEIYRSEAMNQYLVQ